MRKEQEERRVEADAIEGNRRKEKEFQSRKKEKKTWKRKKKIFFYGFLLHLLFSFSSISPLLHYPFSLSLSIYLVLSLSLCLSHSSLLALPRELSS
jgi:hypothetical protein